MRWPWTPPEIRPEIKELISNIENHPNEWNSNGGDHTIWRNESRGIMLWSNPTAQIREPEVMRLNDSESNLLVTALKEKVLRVSVPGDSLLLALRPLSVQRMLDMGVDPQRAAEVYRRMQEK